MISARTIAAKRRIAHSMSVRFMRRRCLGPPDPVSSAVSGGIGPSGGAGVNEVGSVIAVTSSVTKDAPLLHPRAPDREERMRVADYLVPYRARMRPAATAPR